MRDQFAVIWTRAQGTPAKLADMVLTDTELRVSKTESAIEARLPGVSLLHDLAGMDRVVYARSMSRQLPPQLEALLPPQDFWNPQRRILSALLDRQINTRGMQQIEKDWHMLLFAGHGGIGHLDVFRNDEDAVCWYDAQSKKTPAALDDSAWIVFKEYILGAASSAEAEDVQSAVGPTPGVSGCIPKLLSVDRFATGGGVVPAVIKLEKDAYPGLLQLEVLAYEYHRRLREQDVPQTTFREVGWQDQSIGLLSSARFDRAGTRCLPMESFFSILRTGNPTDFLATTDGPMERVAGVFKRLGLPAAQRDQWWQRFVMAMATGNGDLHTENMAIVGGAGEHRLAPVFDPAPMRAYRGQANHDVLSALSFAGIGGVGSDGGAPLPYASSGRTPEDLGTRLLTFAESIGMTRIRAETLMEEVVMVTRDFPVNACDVLATAKNPKMKAPDIPGFRQTLMEVHEALGRALAHRLKRKAPMPGSVPSIS